MASLEKLRGGLQFIAEISFKQEKLLSRPLEDLTEEEMDYFDCPF